MSQFKEYVTSTAFSLNLSKNMVDYLLNLSKEENGYWIPCFMATGDALMRRGLAFREVVDKDKGWSKLKLTDAGEAIIPLLKMAGFSVNVEYKKTS